MRDRHASVEERPRFPEYVGPGRFLDLFLDLECHRFSPCLLANHFEP